MSRTKFIVAGVFSAPSLLLVDSAVKGTALLMLAAVLAIVLRRDSAATRHLVWLLAIVAMLAVPVLSALLPEWRVLPEWASLPSATAGVAASPPSLAGTEFAAVEVGQSAEPDEGDSPSASAYQPAAALPDSRSALLTPEALPASAVGSWNWLSALPLVWAMGFCVLILRLLAARWMLWNTERQGTVIWSSRQPAKATHDTIVTALEAACLQLGIGRPVTLLIHPGRTIPVVWGILRCRLLLPAAARDWSGEQLRSVLLHELAHIKRRDTLAQLLAQTACALHWFNPLVWFAAWRLGVERERACDDLVLASGVRPSAYAGHLLEVVTGLSPTHWTQSCGLAMARRSSLEGRLVAVLSENLNRRGVSVALAAIAITIAIGIAVPVAMLRAADEKPAAPVQQKPVQQQASQQQESQQQESQQQASPQQESQQPKDGAGVPGRLFVNAGLRTTKDEKRFFQGVIAIDPNTGSWTLLQNLSKSGFTVPLSPVRVSPDGGTMLFMREKEIWKCDAITGENSARIFPKGQPKAWAPDGKEFIAVVEKDAGGPDRAENWRVSADGKIQSLLSLPLGVVVEDWSADGRWLVGWSHADGQLHLMQLDGSGPRQLTNTNRNASRNEHPRFSPDGRRIVYLQTLYQGEDDAPHSRFSLRTINSDGTDDREILGETGVAPAPAKAAWTAPMGARWSPDGKHLVVVLFDHTRDGGILAINGNWRLAIIDADGANLRELKLEGVLNTVLPWDGPEWRRVAPRAAVLPDDALWNTKVPFERIPVAITNWSAEKNGLRIGMRVVADEGWRIGGKVQVQMWLHNPGAKNITFNAIPGRSDVGLSVAAKDSEGEDDWAENGNVLIIAIPDPCVLPAGHVAKIKDFRLSFDAPDNKELAWFAPKFRRLEPGKYKLRCVWSDADASVSGAGAWTGKLVTGEVDFMLAAAEGPAQ